MSYFIDTLKILYCSLKIIFAMLIYYVTFVSVQRQLNNKIMNSTIEQIITLYLLGFDLSEISKAMYIAECKVASLVSKYITF